MAAINAKIAERISSGIKKFQPVLANAKSRDVGESDTVMIITDMLSYILGYDKYSEITSELAIKSTYCDLATKIDGKIQMLIEVKAIGLDLKDNFVRQSVDYAANAGIDWVVLTNGINWRIFRVTFAKPIDQELIYEFDFLTLSAKNKDHLESLYLLCKEGWIKSSLSDYHTQKQALSKYFITALLLSDSLLEVMKRELRKISPDVKIETEQIGDVLTNEVIKREILDGDRLDEARKRINKAVQKFQKLKNKTQPTRPKSSNKSDSSDISESDSFHDAEEAAIE